MTRNAVGEQSLLLCIQHTCPSKSGCSSMYVVLGYSWLSQGTRFYTTIPVRTIAILVTNANNKSPFAVYTT